MDVGSILLKARKDAGMTQEELGREIGIERSFVSKIERNKAGLMFDVGIRWLQATQAHEAVIAMICGLDVVTVTETINQLTSLIGGFILWI